MIRILGYTSIYPAHWAPTHGIFVRELFRNMSGMAHVEMVIPENGWRWLSALTQGKCGRFSPNEYEHRCRFWTIPKFLKSFDARLMASFSQTAFRSCLRSKPVLVHAHYAYPDAAAAAILARQAGLPLVVTCHGSDINVHARQPKIGGLIGRVLGQAAAIVTVSAALREKVLDLGVDGARIWTIPNGVDTSLFQLADKCQARMQLGLTEEAPLLLAVGRLEPVKGYDRLLRAMSLLPELQLMFVGEGSLRQSLENMTLELGLAQRVRFAGEIHHDKLVPYYQAADVLVISSHSEGWPTIIHEALACGTPVVAPAVGGIPDALADPGLGVLVETGEPHTLAQGILQALDSDWNPDTLRSAAARHDWRSVARRHVRLYSHVLNEVKS